MQLHPIMYVGDQYAERTFYELFGFQRVYEGCEFPGFLAIGHGEAIIGLQRASPGQPGLLAGPRWQFELGSADQVDEVIATCHTHGLEHEVVIERGGDRFLRRLVAVKSLCGVTVWFEGRTRLAAEPPYFCSGGHRLYEAEAVAELELFRL